MKRRNLKNRKGIPICTFPASKPYSRLIRVEGLLERDFCYHLELASSVVEYDSQPLPLKYIVDGQAHHYTADFFVLYNDGTKKLFEVKDSRYLDDETKELLNIVEEFANASGYEFEVITEKTIRERPLFTNLKHLWDAKQSNSLPEESLDVVKLILGNGNKVLSKDLQGLTGLMTVDIYKLIADGVISVDIHREILGPMCELELSNG